MDARVGARIEVEAPQRWLAPTDYGLLLILLGISTLLHSWLISHTFVTARDSLGFARYALNLRYPTYEQPEGAPVARTFVDVLREAEHPPGYPMTVVAASVVVRKAYPAELPEQMLLSCQIASACAGILLVIPMYGIGRMLLGQWKGFAATLLFQVLPVPAHITSDGLAEALYLLGFAVALFFGMRALRNRSTLNTLLAGMATGASYLVRPEGLIVAVALAGMFVFLGLSRRWPRDLVLGRLVALAIGVMIAASPYMILIGGLTNKSTGKELLERVLGNKNPRASFGTWQHSQRADAPAVLLASWYDAERDPQKPLWAIKALANETFKAGFYAPVGLALIGAFILRKRLIQDPAWTLLLVLATLHAGVLIVLGLKIGYVSERHTLLLVFASVYLAMAALEPVGRAFTLPRFQACCQGRLGAYMLLIGLIAGGIAGSLKPLHENRYGHYQTGKFLGRVATPEDTIVDPFSWALYYSGRAVYSVPPDPVDAPIVYAVWEHSKDNPHSRLPRRLDALNVAYDGWSELVFQWPEQVPPEQAKVLVYKLDRGSQDAVRAVNSTAITPYLVRPGVMRPDRSLGE